MPLKQKAVGAEGKVYGHIFVGPYHHTHAIRLDVSTLTLDSGAGGTVDSKGYLKPGTVVQIDASGTGGGIGKTPTAADQRAGIVPEALPLLDEGEVIATAPDRDVAVAINCAVNRAIIEDNLGRALSAAELGALKNGGVQVLQ